MRVNEFLSKIALHCCRTEHLQETMAELVDISEQLLDQTAEPASIPALHSRRRQLTALKNALQRPAAHKHSEDFTPQVEALGNLPVIRCVFDPGR